MNDLSNVHEVIHNFMLAVERLESLTVSINAMADDVSSRIAGANMVKAPELPTIQGLPANAQGVHPEFTAPVPQAVVAYPQTPQEPAPYSVPTAVPTAAAVEVEGHGVAAPVAPAPAGPNPFTTAQEPAPAKKSGRRTHDELAADAGVRLEDVKAWLGDKKVTKASIEEYAKIKREHEAAAPSTGAGQYVAETRMDYNQQGDYQQQAQAAPVGPYDGWTPEADGQPAPQRPAPQAPPYQPSNPFGAPQGSAPDFGPGAVPQAAPAPYPGPLAEPMFSPFETNQ